jgi:hypothetical protein
MGNQAKSVIDGLAIGIGFVGTMGFAVKPSLFLSWIMVDIAAVTLYLIGRALYNNEP